MKKRILCLLLAVALLSGCTTVQNRIEMRRFLNWDFDPAPTANPQNRLSGFTQTNCGYVPRWQLITRLTTGLAT